jgi:hypothetical protein
MSHPLFFIPADSQTLREVIGESRLRTLTYPKPTAAQVQQRLDALTPEQLLAPTKIVSPVDALCIKGAVYERHDLYDAAHTCAQQAGEGSTASFWHGICHRREPDVSNSKYWFRRVGNHAIFPLLHRAVSDFLATMSNDVARTFRRHLQKKGEWDPFYWIDLCAECDDAQAERVLMEVQEIEWELLFEHTYKAAVAG